MLYDNKNLLINRGRIGFTIVELLIVIVVIGILATFTVIAYNGTRQKATSSVANTDLRNASSNIEITYARNGVFPVTMPLDTKTSPGIVLQLANTGNDSSYCINAYSTNDSSVRSSWDSTIGGLQPAPCSGATIGSAIGGTVPTAPRNQNIVSDFSRWTLTGGATYDVNTLELTMPPAGSARSPIIRVDAPNVFYTGGDLYAANASPSGSIAPSAGFHIGISYFGSDGVTAVTNTAGYTANGCAKGFPTSSWLIGDKRCVFTGGPNVIYSSFVLLGANGSYSSSDLKIKNPLFTVTN